MTDVLNGKKCTSFDIEQSLDVVWEALLSLREDLIPEGDESYDRQWEEICTAMAWITEALEDETN